MSRIGIIAALPGEAKCLYRKRLAVALPIEIEKDILLCLSGMGKTAALTGAKKLCTLNIDALVSWGTAGAIDDRLKTGDILIANRVIGDNRLYSASSDWIKKVQNHFLKASFRTFINPLASADSICDSAEKKTALSKRTNAVAVDMESATLAAMARDHNMDYLILRVIVDEAHDTIPAMVTKHTDHLGRISAGRFLSSCLKQPGQIPAVVKLAKNYQKALSILRQIAIDLKKQHFFYNNGNYPGMG